MIANLPTIRLTTGVLAAVSAVFFTLAGSTGAQAQSVGVWAAGQEAYRDCMSGAETPGKREYCAWRRCLAEMAHTPMGSDPAVLAGAGPCLPLLRSFQQRNAPDTTPSDLVDLPGQTTPSKSPPNRPLGSYSGGTFTPYTPTTYAPPIYGPSSSNGPTIILRTPGWRNPGYQPGWKQNPNPGNGTGMGGCHKNPLTGANHCGKENSPFAKKFNNNNQIRQMRAFNTPRPQFNTHRMNMRPQMAMSRMNTMSMGRNVGMGRSFAMGRRR